MRVYVRWSNSRPPAAAELRLTRFRGVLLAALRVRRYRRWLRAAGLGTADAIACVDSVEPTLELLPITDITEYREWPADFENESAALPGPQRFHFPLGPAPRTAVLMQGFEQQSAVRRFPPEWYRIATFRPEVLAAPVATLRTLAEAMARGRIRLPRLRYALIPFTGVFQGLLREQDRDLFWQVFQVPVFEQHLGPDGCLAAWECGAHQGLHLVPANAVWERAPDSGLLITSLRDRRRPALRLRTAFRGSMAAGDCPCGDASPRLLDLREEVSPVSPPLLVAAG